MKLDNKELKEAFNCIRDLSPDLLNDILNEISNITDVKLCNEYIKNKIGYIKYEYPGKIEYWIKRGWSLQDSKKYANIKKISRKKNNKSPFKIQTWIDKGYSEIEAEYKCKSLKPIYKEYWINKGYSEIEAEEKSKDVKHTNNIKGAKNSAKNKDNINFKINSPLYIEHYLAKGYSETDSILMLKNRQTTFSKEKCIKKYGEHEGLKIWQNRQEKWQKTLQSKTQLEIDNINKNKKRFNITKMKEKYNDYEIYDIIKQYTNKVWKSEDELIKYFNTIILENPSICYQHIDTIISNVFSKVSFEYLNILNPTEYIRKLLGNNYRFGEQYETNNNIGIGYRKRVKEGLLR